jgi:hypothetical protein
MNNNAQFKKFLQQSFDNHEVVGSDDGWDKISSRVSFQNFFKFGTRHVNIYNTTAGIGLALTLYVSIFTDSFQTQLNIPKKEVASTQNEIPLNSQKNIQISKTSTLAIATPSINKNKIVIVQPKDNKIIEKADESFAQSSSNSILQSNAKEGFLNLNALESPVAILQQNNHNIIISNYTKPEISVDKKHFSFDKLRWSVELFTIPVFSDALAINTITKNESLKQKVAAGFALKCLYGKILFETGLVYKSQSKDFAQTIYSVRMTSVVEVKTETKYNTNLITGQVYAAKIDTITRTVKKPVSESEEYKEINTYTTLEIPINLGYRITHKRFSSTSKFGLVTYISKTALGKIVQNNNEKVIELSNVPYSSANFMLTISNSFSYRVRGAFNIFAEPYLKFSTNNPNYNELQIGSDKTMYGIKFGIEVNL